MRVEWTEITGASVASLHGPVNSKGAEAIAAVGLSANSPSTRVVVDLANVTAVDDDGVELLEALSRLRNVAMVNVPAVLVAAMEKLGHFGF